MIASSLGDSREFWRKGIDQRCCARVLEIPALERAHVCHQGGYCCEASRGVCTAPDWEIIFHDTDLCSACLWISVLVSTSFDVCVVVRVFSCIGVLSAGRRDWECVQAIRRNAGSEATDAVFVMNRGDSSAGPRGGVPSMWQRTSVTTKRSPLRSVVQVVGMTRPAV